jgi:DNA repair exonuclease SbcCD ATPase subunit
LLDLRLDGFGKLVDRTFVFDPHFTVVFGPNEAGKSTFASAIVALLYGVGRKDERDGWRPWAGGRYGGALRYALTDGRIFEIQRDFERDPKGVRVFDESGNDVSVDVSIGKYVVPGQAHLKIPLEVFLNAACVRQGQAEIDGARAERISTVLAQALDGGPREDAALGAINSLDEAIAKHVGTKRATVNTPLRDCQGAAAETEARATEVRRRLRELDDLRARLQAERERVEHLDFALQEHDRRARAFRAYALHEQIAQIRDLRADVAALHRERLQYADVGDFPLDAATHLERLFHAWRTAEALAASTAESAQASRLTPALESELSERIRDGGALDEEAFERLAADVATAVDARAKSTFASNAVLDSKRSVSGGNEVFGAVLTAGALVAAAAVVLAVFHEWLFAPAAALLALVFFVVAWLRWSARRKQLAASAAMERAADAAIAAEHDAAMRVAAVLEPLGVPSFDEFVRRRERARALYERRLAARRDAERAAQARADLSQAARTFDAEAAKLTAHADSREAALDAVREREARRRARDGIDSQLSFLEVRRGDLLGTDDEFALESELAELLGAGVVPAEPERSLRAFAAERVELERACSESKALAAALEAELRTSEAQCEDLAALDERSAELRAECAKLERFEAAVTLAKLFIEKRTREAHQQFASRLANYASQTFSDITSGRYSDVRVDPTTLALKIRVPENREFVGLDRLSVGTREQAYLVVRLAMVRIFSEGLETAPLLLDDPFAHWDDERMQRSFDVFSAAARDVQTILFTTQRSVAEAAAARGAHLIDLSEDAASAVLR